MTVRAKQGLTRKTGWSAYCQGHQHVDISLMFPLYTKREVPDSGRLSSKAIIATPDDQTDLDK